MVNLPTLNEYRDMVRKAFLSICKDYVTPMAKIEQYFNSTEAQELIEARYKTDVEELKSGRITENVFRNGCVYSVASCLDLMME